MKYLLDTNIISETAKNKPNTNVVSFLKSVSSERLFLSVLTIGEIRKGIELLKDHDKKNKLVYWLEHDVPIWFGKNILPIDLKVSEQWGLLMADRSLPAIDSLIAATSLVHNLILVTRNVNDFDMITNLEIFNPFT